MRTNCRTNYLDVARRRRADIFDRRIAHLVRRNLRHIRIVRGACGARRASCANRWHIICQWWHVDHCVRRVLSTISDRKSAQQSVRCDLPHWRTCAQRRATYRSIADDVARRASTVAARRAAARRSIRRATRATEPPSALLWCLRQWRTPRTSFPRWRSIAGWCP